MKVIDLFAGAGGFSTGAEMAGCKVVWAANHWQSAVTVHTQNHPATQHVCQDLHQANWHEVPSHDGMLASPCCQGHSKARGKASGNPQHDASRSTAWAVTSAAEVHKPDFIVVENVPEFLKWSLYPAWQAAMEALGYSLAIHIIDAANHGAPQHRERMFIVLTRSKKPLQLKLERRDHVAASSFIDFDAPRWQPIDKPGRAPATLARIAAGRRMHGQRFISSYYGNEKGGRSLSRPIGTITTRDRHAVIDGDRMRMISVQEARAAMTFPASYILPTNQRAAIHMLGNAVVPVVARDVINAIKVAA
ncbi:MAG: (cytosine-5-)-methyltransferase [Polaromonas sp.]|nr:(cytosine-5-)-methyltransferase [Polaromonas sp.]